MQFEDVQRMAMIGSGTMGTGMAMCYAQAGYSVALYSRTSQSLERALGRIENSQALFVQEGLISSQEAEAAKARIRPTTSQEEALEGVQYVLESVPEDLELKQKLFQGMEAQCPDDTILATNTSGLSITAIASVCRHPERVVGQHWANPPEIVPLVEVIRGEQTSDRTMDLVYQITRKLGKAPVRVQKDISGFASNRLQYAVLREALYLVEAGVLSPEDVDRTLKNGVGFRYPWLGPLETVDLGGLDVFHTIAQYLFKELSTMQTSPEFFDRLAEEGKYGIKAGEGFYRYEPDARDEILRKRDLYFIRQLKLLGEVREQ
ncbi:MAG: 3-hydroxyacyl-CoA dehydrogenase family protein [Anaerolineae bacterium]|jgi:3-hydroxybutyryl-CoA dehydrogenase